MPVLDYGACPSPSWPVRIERAVDESRLITDLGALLDLDGVRRVQGSLTARPPALASLALGNLCPLAGLQHVDDLVTLRNLDVTNLDGLQSLAFVGGGVAVVDNPALTDIAALGNLQVAPPPDDVGRALEFSVFVANNPALPPEAVDALAVALRPAGISVFGCGNQQEPDCDGTFAPVLSFLRQR
jgi:hypothetical protein